MVSEVQHLQSTKYEKEEKLKGQIGRNEELLEELERVNMAMQQVREEREMTMQMKTEKEREVEGRDRERQKWGRLAERVHQKAK